jgi:hypothetical protein
MKARISGLFALSLLGCNPDTGSGLVTFPAYAAGPEQATAGQPYVFDSAAGYRVELERARLTIGAVYLNRSRLTLGAQDTPCVLPGVYVAEVTSGVVIDALSPELVEFGAKGRGTLDRALTGEVWLTGGRIDATSDTTKILDVAGTATRDGAAFGFHGVITISQNRALGSPDPATPGANPLCKQRIVTPIPVDITPSNQGSLELRVAPEIWFAQVDFAQLPGAVGQSEVTTIPDSSENAAAFSLYQGLRSLEGYRFEWGE